jgi:hypothetical protein
VVGGVKESCHRPRVENRKRARLTSGSYVILNPGSYYTLVLCFAGFVLGVAILAVAPVWNVYLSPLNPRQTACCPAVQNH